MWGYEQGGRLLSLCYRRRQPVPVQATSPGPIRRVRWTGRCARTALLDPVGMSTAVKPNCGGSCARTGGRPVDLRASADGDRRPVTGSPLTPVVKAFRLDELDILAAASIACSHRGGRISRWLATRRVLPGAGFQAVRSGGAFRAESKRRVILFKAEVGAAPRRPAGCRRLGPAGATGARAWPPPRMAAVVRAWPPAISRWLSLYVNDFNTRPRDLRGAGFAEIGESCQSCV